MHTQTYFHALTLTHTHLPMATRATYCPSPRCRRVCAGSPHLVARTHWQSDLSVRVGEMREIVYVYVCVCEYIYTCVCVCVSVYMCA
jgi:hypothetical protein